MEANGDNVNVGAEVKWVKFEERKLVEDKGIQFDIQRSVEVVSNKEKEQNENNGTTGNANNNNNSNNDNNVKDNNNNVPVVVEEK